MPDGPLAPFHLMLQPVLLEDAEVLHWLDVAADDVRDLAHTLAEEWVCRHELDATCTRLIQVLDNSELGSRG